MYYSSVELQRFKYQCSQCVLYHFKTACIAVLIQSKTATYHHIVASYNQINGLAVNL